MSTTAQQNSSQYVDFDEYIDFQLQKTRSNIKWTDMLTAGTGVLALVLGYLLVFVLFDHWVVDGGFGPLTRGLMLGVVIIGACGWIIWKVVLPYLKRVTTLYAARTLETSDPKLKSSLLNFVDLAGSGREIPEHIRTAMEKQAATTLANVDVEEAVDRKPLLKLSYLLLGIVVLGSMYTLLSPKKPWSSIQAALMPAAERTYATRTQITEVKPGDVDVLARTNVDVTVYLRGENPKEVTLLFTTEDEKFVDEPIEMRLKNKETKEYRCLLSGENGRGLLQNLTYRIVAGDAESKSYRVTVKHPPTANVQQVFYQYPKYMELAPRTVPTGHIDAWEGTTITVQATANQPVTRAMLMPLDREEFTPESHGVPLPMQIKNGTELSLKWKLEIRPDRTSPHYYAVQCYNKAGETDPSPVLYSLKIRPDKAPILELVEPRSDLEAPANAIIPLIVKARDPDFKLSYVTLKAEKAGEELAGTPILFDGSIKKKRQNYSGTFDWKLEDYELQPGDVITFWVEARDNKLPLPNRKNSPKLHIKIVKPVSKAEAEKQLEEEKEKQQERLDQKQAEPNKENEMPEDNPQDDEKQDEKEQQDNTDQKEKQDDSQQQNDKKGKPQEGEGNPDSQQKTGEGEKQNPAEQKNNAEQNGNKEGKQQGGKESQQNEEQDDGDVLQKIMKRQQQKKDGKSDPSQKQGDGQQQQNDKQKEGDKKGQQPPEDKQNPSKEQNGNSNKKEDGKQNDKEMQGNKPPEEDGQKKESDQKKEGSQQKGDKKEGGNKKQGDKKEGAGGDKQKEQTGNKENPDNMQGDGDEKQSDKKEGGKKDAGNNKEGDNKKPDGNDGKTPAGNDNKNKENAGKGEDPQQGEGTASKSDDKNKMSQPGETDGGKKSSEKEGGKKSDSAVEDGKETPAEPDKDAKKVKAKGDETGEGVPDKDPNATQAKKPDQIKPKEGTKPEKKQTKGNGNPKEGNPNKKESGKKQDGKESASGKKEQGKMQPKEGDSSANPKPNGNKSSDKKEGQPKKGNPPQEGMPKKGERQPPKGGSKKSKPANKEQGSQSNKQGEGNSSSKKKGSKKPGDKKGGQEKSGDKKEGANKKEGGKKEGSKQGEGKSDEKSEGGEKGKGQGTKGESSGTKGEGKTPGKSGEGKQTGPDGMGGGNGNASATGTGSGKGEASVKEEAADIDHAKKATDLALKQLEDELKRGKVDEELLKELGWSEEKMKQFAKRMRKQLNKVGKADDIASKAREQQFIEMLKTLDTTKGAESRKGKNENIKNLKGYSDRRLPIPAEYREAYEAYTRSLSKKASRK